MVTLFIYCKFERGEKYLAKLVTENVFKSAIQTILKIIKNRRIKTSQLDETSDLKIMTKDERDKLKKITSSGTGKNFLSDDFTYKPIEIGVMSETPTQKILTAQEREKISKLNIAGSANEFLSEDGTYKKINADVIENGTTNKLLTKTEKDKVEKLSITGAPDEFLAKDGLYKKINADNVLDGTTNKIYTQTEKDKVNRINTSGTPDKFFAEDGLYRKISADNILDGAINKLYTNNEKNKVEKLIIAGDGTKVLTDNGTYRTPTAVNVISDTKLDTNLAYSNVKIENIISNLVSNTDSKLLQKSDINHTHQELNQAHDHKNKNVLDDITLSDFSKWNKLVEKINPEIIGTGTKILYDDLVFRDFSGSSGSSGSNFDLFDKLDMTQLKILQKADTLDPGTIYKILSLKYPIFVCTVDEYELLQNRNEIDPNTIYFVIDPNADDTGGSGTGNGSIIITSGDGTKVLADNGIYKKIIDDNLDSSTEQTYSIDKIVETVGRLITSSNDSSIKIWKKQKLNVSAGDTFDVLVTEPDVLTKNPVVVQCYKFVEGENDIAEILKVFDNTDAENFVYDKESVMFDNIEGMQIIDSYTVQSSLNADGLYESELIDTSYFEIFDRIEVI